MTVLRENAILAAVNAGHVSLDAIVQQVYKDVPQAMWEVAKSNIKLHLRKLQQEGKIKTTSNM